jgi:hypothetical protein
MRLVANIPHPKLKISILSFMDKWIIEIEGGAYKQAFKISHDAIPSEEEVKKLLTEELLQGCMDRFNGMHTDFGRAFQAYKNA